MATSPHGAKYKDLHTIPPPQEVWISAPAQDAVRLYAAGAHFDIASRVFVVDGRKFTRATRFFAQWPHVKIINGLRFHGNRLPGEDLRFGGNQLTIDMIPRRCSFQNARTAIDPGDWRILGAIIHARAGNRCECCSSKPGDRRSFVTGDPLELHCHERWDFDFASRKQTLKRLVSLCDECHASTHMGHSKFSGYGIAAATHMAAVRGISLADVAGEYREAIQINAGMNKLEWAVDLSIINDAGITLSSVEERAALIESVREARMGYPSQARSVGAGSAVGASMV